MSYRSALPVLLLGLSAGALAQDSHGELAKVKEQELEEVRERISELSDGPGSMSAPEASATSSLGRLFPKPRVVPYRVSVLKKTPARA